jgi:hypothetical protein
MIFYCVRRNKVIQLMISFFFSSFFSLVLLFDRKDHFIGRHLRILLESPDRESVVR